MNTRFIQIGMLVFAWMLIGGCASGPSVKEVGWYTGNINNAPLNRLEPGTVVRFRLKPLVDARVSTVERTLQEGDQTVTYQISLAAAHPEINTIERTVSQVYGGLGFITTAGEGVRFGQIDFLYRLSAGEQIQDKALTGAAIMLAVPCILLGSCPMQ